MEPLEFAMAFFAVMGMVAYLGMIDPFATISLRMKSQHILMLCIFGVFSCLILGIWLTMSGGNIALADYLARKYE